MTVVLSISSHVARGHVGNMAVATVMHALGIEVWQVPTIALSNHKGYGSCTGAVTPDGTIRGMVDALGENGWLGQVDAVLSGYVATPDQASDILHAVNSVKTANDKAIYWCDPILGDFPGGLYVPEKVARAIAEQLLPRAEGTSPNTFELEWLSGIPIKDAETAVLATQKLRLNISMTTSVPSGSNNAQICNVLTAPDLAMKFTHRKFDHVPHGTGDTFTALALGHLLHGGSNRRNITVNAKSAFEAASGQIFSLAQKSQGREELDRDAIIAAAQSSTKASSATPI